MTSFDDARGWLRQQFLCHLLQRPAAARCMQPRGTHFLQAIARDLLGLEYDLITCFQTAETSIKQQLSQEGDWRLRPCLCYSHAIPAKIRLTRSATHPEHSQVFLTIHLFSADAAIPPDVFEVGWEYASDGTLIRVHLPPMPEWTTRVKELQHGLPVG